MSNEPKYEKTSDRLTSLEIHRLYAATKTDISNLEGSINADIKRLEGKFDTSVETMKGFISEAVSQTEIKTLKLFLKGMTTTAGILIPVLTAILAVLLNTVLNR